MDNAKVEKPEAALAPDGHEVPVSPGEKTGQTLIGGGEDRAAPRAGAARPPVTREVPEGPAVAADPPRQAAGRSGPEDERAPTPLLPAWRDETGRGGTVLGAARHRGAGPRRRQGPGGTARGRCPDTYLAGHLSRSQGRGRRNGRADPKIGERSAAAAQTLRQDGPEVLGELRGREGWLAREAAKTERTYARSAAGTIPARLDQEATARDAAARRHAAEVEQQRTRDAVAVPGLSGASLAALENVRTALDATDRRNDGERYDVQQRRREKRSRAPGPPGGPIRAWLANWTGSWPRLGSGLAGRGCGMLRVPPASGSDDRARRRAGTAGRTGRSGAEFQTRPRGRGAKRGLGNRLGREVQVAERERARQEERQRLGLPPEPTPEQQRKGLGLSR